MAADERIAWLSDHLGRHERVSIAEASRRLGVSEMTVRRDLAELEEQGIARRVRGGARALGPQSFSERRDTRVRAKSRIAAKLVALLPATGVVTFDASSTVMRVGALVGDARDLTVLTNGPDTFNALQGRAGVTPVLTGGALDPRTGSLVGPIAVRAAESLASDLMVSSALAIDTESGSFEPVLEEAEVKLRLAAMTNRVVLAVDSSKLDRRAGAAALGWDRVDTLVTELDPRDERLRPYRRLARVL
jgi:DeoR family fructose operon transcriptional repressor